MSADLISAYTARLEPKQAAVCDFLRAEIEAALPQATAKIWRRRPAWFIGENPVVGYAATKSRVTLLFWNGRRFGDLMLTAVGKFSAAQIVYEDVANIDVVALRRWIKKSRTRIWDLAGTRNRLLASRRNF